MRGPRVTLIDNAERLTTLAQDAGTVEAALHEVLDRLLAIRPTIDYGIVKASWWQHVPEPERVAVRMASERAAATVRPLETESDQVLAAYGRGDATIDRGALAALLRAFREYRTALQQAQDEVLRTWNEACWPPEEEDKLEIHALVPETAPAAREILALMRDLARAIEDARALDDEALRRLAERRESAEADTAMLRQRPVPPPVLDFFRQVRELETLPLSEVAGEVFAWLEEYDATRLFVISRPA
jgi:hypothetical protein